MDALLEVEAWIMGNIREICSMAIPCRSKISAQVINIRSLFNNNH